MKKQATSCKHIRLDEALQQARQLTDSGQFPAADQLYQKIIHSAPDCAQAWHDWGQLGLRLRQLQTTLPILTRAVELAPDKPAFRYTLAQLQSQLGDYSSAEKSMLEVTRLAPANPAGHQELGLIYKRMRRFPEAIKSLQRATRLAANDSNSHFNLGLTFFAAGDIDAAIKAYRQALAIDSNDSESHSALGAALHAAGNFPAARKQLQLAIQLEPDNPNWYRNLAESLREQGMLAQAIENYRQGLKRNSNDAALWHGLAMTQKFTVRDQEDIMAIKSLYAQQARESEEQTKLAFAIGKILDDCKQETQAWPYFQTANHNRRVRKKYNIEEEREYFQTIKQTFTADFFHQQADSPSLLPKQPYGQPIFIIGMPRSGTSLVEQILASHSQIHGCGETQALSIALRDTLGQVLTGQQLLQQFCFLDSQERRIIAENYLTRITTQGNGEQWLSNKLPFNFLHLGLIKILFPDAKIFHCCRHPLATCLSIYQHDFTHMDGFAYDLQELAQYYLLYHDLMQHWHDVLPGYVQDIHYETLVAEQESQSRQLIKACELPWEASCLDFHQTNRAVSTASFTQVRQPLYRHALERGQRYEPLLTPLTSILNGILPKKP